MDAQIEQSFFKIKEKREIVSLFYMKDNKLEILEQGPTIDKREADSYKAHLLELFKKPML